MQVQVWWFVFQVDMEPLYILEGSCPEVARRRILHEYLASPTGDRIVVAQHQEQV